MSTVLGRSLALAFGGLVAGLGLVLALFGGGLRERWAPAGDAATPRPLTAPQAAKPEGGAVAALPETRSPAKPPPGGSDAAVSPPAPTPTLDGPKTATNEADKPDPAVPSFDVVRVEPNGESVVAGRAKPDSTVEMLVDGKPVAQARADRDGQFAIVPPRLPPGSSEIVLRATGADGREVRSKQSVAVALPATPGAKPLVALTAPDRPTAVLSQPEAAPQAAGAGPATATPLRIVSVDAQENGRLYVSSEAPPGAVVRLYLNDTLIAPGQAGADGKVTFTIGKGVRPGAYRIRIDQVESGTGKVRIRAEVPFTVPETAVQVAARTEAARPAAEPTSPKPAETAGSETPRSHTGTSEAVSAEAASPGTTKPGTAKPDTGKPDIGMSAAGRSGTDKPGSAGAAEPARPGEQATLPDPARRPAGPAPRDARTEASRPEQAPASGSRPAAPAPARTADAAGNGAPQAAGSVFVPEINTARIERGNSLWQISRRAYGRGNRYTVIYDANQEQIRDPDLIYPGQIFVLPDDKTGAGQGGHKRG
ncbi:LysM peptidoglycan-binding domain-containing protein [Methylobacterium symbioticum]|nr:LysM peptidoglycan-binding domain-containing protein [uncultured Methylobacterium sp.]